MKLATNSQQNGPISDVGASHSQSIPSHPLKTTTSNNKISPYKKLITDEIDDQSLDLSKIYKLSLLQYQNARLKSKEQIMEHIEQVKQKYEPLKELETHSRVICMASRNGKLAVGLKKPVINIYDIFGSYVQEFQMELRQHRQFVNNLEFSTDCQYLFSASKDKQLICWKADKRNHGHYEVYLHLDEKLEFTYKWIFQLLWSDAHGLLFCRIDNRVKVFNMQRNVVMNAKDGGFDGGEKSDDGFELVDLEGGIKEEGRVTCMALTKDGTTLITGHYNRKGRGASEDKSLKFWKFNKLTSRANPDSSTARPAKLKLSLISQVNEKRKPARDRLKVSTISISNDGNKMIVIHDNADLENRIMSIWRRREGSKNHPFKQVGKCKFYEEDFTKAAISANGKLMAACGGNLELKVFKLDFESTRWVDVELIDVYQGHQEQINSLLFVQEDQYVVSGSMDKTIKKRSIEHLVKKMMKEKVPQIESEKNHIFYDLRLSQDESVLVTFSVPSTELKMVKEDLEADDYLIRIFRFSKSVGDYKEIQSINGIKAFGSDISEDNRWILFIKADKIYIFNGDPKTKSEAPYKQIKTIRAEQEVVRTARFMPITNQIVSAGKNNTIILWRFNSVKQAYKEYDILVGHNDSVNALCISRDHSLIISGSQDGECIIWRKELRSLLPTSKNKNKRYQYMLNQIIATTNPLKTIHLINSSRLLILGDSEARMLVYYRHRSYSKFLENQIVESAHKSTESRFIVYFFRNDEYMVTLGDEGTSIKVWYIDANTMIPLYNMGMVKTGVLGTISFRVLAVEILRQDRVSILRLSASQQVEKNFEIYKMFEVLFTNPNVFVDKNRVKDLLVFFKDKLSQQGIYALHPELREEVGGADGVTLTDREKPDAGEVDNQIGDFMGIVRKDQAREEAKEPWVDLSVPSKAQSKDVDQDKPGGAPPQVGIGGGNVDQNDPDPDGYGTNKTDNGFFGSSRPPDQPDGGRENIDKERGGAKNPKKEKNENDNSQNHNSREAIGIGIGFHSDSWENVDRPGFAVENVQIGARKEGEQDDEEEPLSVRRSEVSQKPRSIGENPRQAPAFQDFEDDQSWVNEGFSDLEEEEDDFSISQNQLRRMPSQRERKRYQNRFTRNRKSRKVRKIQQHKDLIFQQSEEELLDDLSFANQDNSMNLMEQMPRKRRSRRRDTEFEMESRRKGGYKSQKRYRRQRLPSVDSDQLSVDGGSFYRQESRPFRNSRYKNKFHSKSPKKSKKKYTKKSKKYEPRKVKKSMKKKAYEPNIYEKKQNVNKKMKEAEDDEKVELGIPSKHNVGFAFAPPSEKEKPQMYSTANYEVDGGPNIPRGSPVMVPIPGEKPGVDVINAQKPGLTPSGTSEAGSATPSDTENYQTSSDINTPSKQSTVFFGLRRGLSQMGDEMEVSVKSYKKIDYGALIKAAKEEPFKLVNRIKDFAKIHGRWNLLLLASLSTSASIVQSVLNRYEYMHFYYQEGFDPIDAAIKIDQMSILNIYAAYFSESQIRRDSFIPYLTLRRLTNSMKTSSQAFKEFVLETAFFVPKEYKAEFLKEYPLGDNSKFEVFHSNGSTYNVRLNTRIHNKANMRSKKRSIFPVRYKIFRYAYSDSIFSDSALQLLQAFHYMSDELKQSDYMYIVRHFWNANYFIICLMAMYNVGTYAVFVLYVVWFDDLKWLGALSICLSSLLLVYELTSIFKDSQRWLASYYNYLDIYQYVCIPGIVALNLAGVIDKEDAWLNFWVAMTLLLAGFRALGELRVIGAIRYLISMITQTAIDMASFVVIVGIMLFLFSLGHIFVSKSTTNQVLSFRDLGLTLDYYYNVANGDQDQIDGLSFNQLAIHYISGIILAVMMMNLLIAVISLTFDQFQEKKELVDLDEMNTILCDHSIFFSFLKKFFCWEMDEAGYLHCFVIKVEESEEDLGMAEIKKKIEGLEGGLSDGVAKLEVALYGLRDMIKEAFDRDS